MRANGGEDYLTAKESTKSIMVIFLSNLGDIYTGNFKNGLKHGVGQ